MQLVVFVGLQASGKSNFYRQRFAETHLRLSMDMLRTRYRERLLFEACLEGKQPVVIDNTNPAVEDRAKYVLPAKAKGFGVVGYYFQSKLEECKARNMDRVGEAAVPLAGMLGTYKRLAVPTRAEGFDQLYYVRMDGSGGFVVEEWDEAKNADLAEGEC